MLYTDVGELRPLNLDLEIEFYFTIEELGAIKSYLQFLKIFSKEKKLNML